MSGPSLVRAVVVRAMTVVVACLVGVGVMSAVGVHVAARRSLDATLLAAARGHAHPDPKSHWELEHAWSPVEVITDGEAERPPFVDPGWVEASLDDERPSFHTVDGKRILVVIAEQRELDSLGEDEQPDRPDREREVHHVVLAWTEEPSIWETTHGFLFVYAVVATVGALGSGVMLSRTMEGAVGPMSRAAQRITGLRALTSADRLPVEGASEVEALLLAVNDLLGRLEESFAAQSRFTAEAAHELRTPVTAMLGELDVALRRPRSAEEYATVLASTRDEVRRLGALVEALLSLARVDTGQVERGKFDVELADLATDALEQEAPALAAAGNTVSAQLERGVIVRAHRTLAVTAIANLLRNVAVHAPGTRLSLRTEVVNGRARVVVEDEGPGIAGDVRSAVFERFTRGSVARSRTPGLGLGLAMSREIARRHGGDCTIEEARGGGCCVALDLGPALQADLPS